MTFKTGKKLKSTILTMKTENKIENTLSMLY